MKSVLYIFSLCFLFISVNSWAKTNCRIDFQIKGLEYKAIIFAMQYGEKQLIIDTIQLNNQAMGFYESKERLTGGIYVVIFPSTKYFELLINDEQFFSLISDTTETMKNLIVEGSEETELFRQYQVKSSIIAKTIRYNSENAKTEALEFLNKDLSQFKDSIQRYMPLSFINKYFQMQLEPTFPDSLLKTQKPGREMFVNLQQYKKNHYFDNVDFKDHRLLRTRLLHEKLQYFFNVLLSQQADSVCKEIDFLLHKTQANEEAYRYILSMLNQNYRQANTSQQEKILVYLADQYYLNGKAPWADPRFVKLLQEKCETLRPALMGVKAANLELQTIDGKKIDIYNIDAPFLVIFFWSDDCKVCLAEAEKLNQFYLKNKSKGIEILAIYVHADKNGFQDFLARTGYNWKFAYDPILKSNFSKLYRVDSTPKIFLLNQEKTILDKSSNTNAFEQYLVK